ncbi:MAG TPA: HEPN domain-containing protein [Gemmatimonadota bacterium]|nr:HEPN domain-containing protein [Gemmatimonadota bacterium]
MQDPDHARLLLGMARKHLRALSAMLDPNSFAEEIFGFHAQQAAERSIKAWLSLIGRSYPRTHDLGALLELLEVPWESVPSEAWELVELTDFAVQLRYESFEYDDERLDRLAVVSQIAVLVERVEELVNEGNV